MVFAVIMVPVVMALGRFNVFSNIGHRRDQPKKQQ
nr:hypothetical protein [Enterobacter hormaechei]